MLVGTGASEQHPGRGWRRGLWASVLLAALAVLSLAPYLGSSSELVRMRNALLMVGDGSADVGAWTPASPPPDFRIERGPTPELFAKVAGELQLDTLPDDWQRALAIARHLLSQGDVRPSGAIMGDLQGTYRSIVTQGNGYCGDYVDVFMAIAAAAGMPVRAWAFSFDGFGGEGHIWPEIWNRAQGRWQLLDIFNNAYFPDATGAPRSAMALRQAMLASTGPLERMPLVPAARMGMHIEDKAWSYYRRGLPEWYLWWGNDVFSYDRAALVRTFTGVSRSMEQLGAVAQGVHPAIHVLAEASNLPQREAMARLRIHLYVVLAALVFFSVMVLVCAMTLIRLRSREQRDASRERWSSAHA